MKSQGLARIGKDANVQYTQKGTAVANIPLAYNYGRKDEQGNFPTQWVQASLWGPRAESLAQYLTKGKAIVAYLDDMHNEEYQTRNGEAGSAMVARLYDLEFVPSGNGNRQSGQQQAMPNSQPRQSSQSKAQTNAEKAANTGSEMPSPDDDSFEDLDDIPF